MKQFFLTICLTVSSIFAFGQSTNVFPSIGNVGIGTTDPITDLQVMKTSQSGAIRIGGANNIGNGRVFIQADILANNSYIDVYGDNTYKKLSIEASPLILNRYSLGNVAIGFDSPTEKLDVNGNIKWNGFNSGNSRALKTGYSGGNYGGVGYNIDYTEVTGTFNRPLADYTSYLEFTYGGFKFFGTDDFGSASNVNLNGGGKNLNLRAVITREGNMGIGIANPSEKLAVNGNIRAREIKVETANWPDYVFAKDYELLSLAQTEKEIKEKGHLPGIPSAAEVKANGIDLGEMNAKLLQKIEELTLYIIDLEKRMKRIEVKN